MVVLFTDVVGSTALAERTDPEALRHILDRYFSMCAESIADHEGVVEKYIGDAVMAVFGVPSSHEDDALRAVRAAVAIHTDLALLNASLTADHGVRLELRTGVSSGQCLTLFMPDGEFRVIGDAVNTASRLQTAAAPGEILVGGDVATMVTGRIPLDAAPPLTVKGKTRPVPAWRVVPSG